MRDTPIIPNDPSENNDDLLLLRVDDETSEKENVENPPLLEEEEEKEKKEEEKEEEKKEDEELSEEEEKEEDSFIKERNPSLKHRERDIKTLSKEEESLEDDDILLSEEEISALEKERKPSFSQIARERTKEEDKGHKRKEPLLHSSYDPQKEEIGQESLEGKKILSPLLQEEILLSGSGNRGKKAEGKFPKGKDQSEQDDSALRERERGNIPVKKVKSQEKELEDSFLQRDRMNAGNISSKERKRLKTSSGSLSLRESKKEKASALLPRERKEALIASKEESSERYSHLAGRREDESSVRSREKITGRDFNHPSEQRREAAFARKEQSEKEIGHQKTGRDPFESSDASAKKRTFVHAKRKEEKPALSSRRRKENVDSFANQEGRKEASSFSNLGRQDKAASLGAKGLFREEGSVNLSEAKEARGARERNYSASSEKVFHKRGDFFSSAASPFVSSQKGAFSDSKAFAKENSKKKGTLFGTDKEEMDSSSPKEETDPKRKLHAKRDPNVSQASSFKRRASEADSLGVDQRKSAKEIRLQGKEKERRQASSRAKNPRKESLTGFKNKEVASSLANKTGAVAVSGLRVKNAAGKASIPGLLPKEDIKKVTTLSGILKEERKSEEKVDDSSALKKTKELVREASSVKKLFFAPTLEKNGAGFLNENAKKARESDFFIRRFLSRRTVPFQLGGRLGVKKMALAVGKKVAAVGLSSSLAIGGVVGGAAALRQDGWESIQAHQYTEDNRTLTQEVADMMRDRMSCYFDMLRGRQVSEEERKKAGDDIVPFYSATLGRANQNLDVSFATARNLRLPYTYISSSEEGSSSYTKEIAVSQSASDIELSFVDRDGKPIQRDYFQLDARSDLLLPGEMSAETVASDASTAGLFHENSQTQMDILLNAIGGVETGGQIYGKRNYAEFKDAIEAGEKHITIGWSSFYGSAAQDYFSRYLKERREEFLSIDSSGQLKDLVEIGAIANLRGVSEYAKNTIIRLETTEYGKKLQDSMTAERLLSHWKYCASSYTKNARSVLMYTAIAEHGGRGGAKRVMKMAKDYDMKSLKDAAISYYTGLFPGITRGFTKRYDLLHAWIVKYIPQDELIDLANVSVTGAGVIFDGGGNALNADDEKGQLLLFREILAMSVYGGFYENNDPTDSLAFKKYCLSLFDAAVTKRGIEVSYDFFDTGSTFSWTNQRGETCYAPENGMKASVKLPILVDLKALEESDRHFKYWDLESEKYGDHMVQSVVALANRDFEERFKARLTAASLSHNAASDLGGYASVDANLGYVKWAIAIAEDDSHGYSQPRRNGPDYDCSSLISYALRASGFQIPIFSTSNEEAVLKSVGFESVFFSSFSDLKEGDILWRRGHTEIYIGNGMTVGAHCSETGGIDGMPGDQNHNEIGVAKTSIKGWVKAFRNPNLPAM